VPSACVGASSPRIVEGAVPGGDLRGVELSHGVIAEARERGPEAVLQGRLGLRPPAVLRHEGVVQLAEDDRLDLSGEAVAAPPLVAVVRRTDGLLGELFRAEEALERFLALAPASLVLPVRCFLMLPFIYETSWSGVA
jgi:hypothetical protein